MLNFLKIILYNPLVNVLALLVSVIPGGDVGIAVVVLTILVKIILYPFSQHTLENQAKMALLSPELNKIKLSGANREEQAKQTFELYKKHKTNPFSGCLVQIPVIFIIIALYSVFNTGINFDSNILYSFVHAPEHINMMFLGIIDLGKKSLILAILAGVSQYFQAHFMPKIPVSGDAGSFAESFGKNMNIQMKYIFPFVIFLILYTNFLGSSSGGSAIALYWITSNIFTIGQQIYANKKNG